MHLHKVKIIRGNISWHLIVARIFSRTGEPHNYVMQVRTTCIALLEGRTGRRCLFTPGEGGEERGSGGTLSRAPQQWNSFVLPSFCVGKWTMRAGSGEGEDNEEKQQRTGKEKMVNKKRKATDRRTKENWIQKRVGSCGFSLNFPLDQHQAMESGLTLIWIHD